VSWTHFTVKNMTTNVSPRIAECAGCIHFQNHSQHLEANIPGLRTMGSGFSSVRAQDGLCALHQRYLSAQSSCLQFSSHDAARR